MAEKQPNIVLIHTDQQRGDSLGVAGKRGLFTPHLDALANGGARFTSAYSTCPVCIPQRMTLMSGQLAPTHGVLWNVGIPDFPFEFTLPGELAKAGYQTAHVGRTMHLRPDNKPYGFEYYIPGDPSASKKKEDRFFQFIERHAPVGSGGYYGNGTGNNSHYGAPFHLPDHLHHTFWSTTQALEFLERRDESRPFFLSVGYYAPHGPQNPPAHEFEKYYAMEGLEEPAIGEWAVPPVASTRLDSNSYIRLEGELLRRARAGYYGNITFIDAQVGRLLSKLNLYDTYVMFTSDHGEMFGDHYRYHKTVGYEGSAHIPMMIAGPGVTPLTVRDEPVGWHDILPTFLDLAAAPIPEKVDGKSLKPLFNGGSAPEWRDALVGECTWGLGPEAPGQQKEGNLFYEGGHHFVTNGKRKLLWHPKSGTEQFFDLEADPHELHDLAGDPERAKEVDAWRTRLVEALADRPEGFSDGNRLIAGTKMERMMPHAKKLCDQRIEEGYDILYYHEVKRRG